jgi:hypothetical protein
VVREHRRARAPELRPLPPTDTSTAPAADWLGHLVEQRRQQGFVEPPPRRHVEQRQRQRAEAQAKLLSDAAIRQLFSASAGRPRSINQLAVQALIQAAVLGRDEIDGDFMRALIQAHPLFQAPVGGGR